VMHKWRYHAGIVELGRIARSGELGPVHGLQLMRVQWGHPRRDVDAITTLVPHDLSIALEILGHVPRARDARCDAVAGEGAALWATLGDKPWVVLHDSVREMAVRRQCQLHCRDGVARLGDSYDAHIEILRACDVPTDKSIAPLRRTISQAMPLRLQIEAFLAWIRGDGEPPRSSLTEEAEIVRVIHDLRRLAE